MDCPARYDATWRLTWTVKVKSLWHWLTAALRWWVGGWQTCSATCGPDGVRKRTVLCVRTVAGEERVLHTGDCRQMLKPKPAVPCNRDVPCGSEWVVGNWTEVGVISFFGGVIYFFNLRTLFFSALCPVKEASKPGSSSASPSVRFCATPPIVRAPPSSATSRAARPITNGAVPPSDRDSVQESLPRSRPLLRTPPPSPTIHHKPSLH